MINRLNLAQALKLLSASTQRALQNRIYMKVTVFLPAVERQELIKSTKQSPRSRKILRIIDWSPLVVVRTILMSLSSDTYRMKRTKELQLNLKRVKKRKTR